MTMGTYEIRNRLNGKAYGGSSGNIEKRRQKHLSMLRAGEHHCAYFQNAWNKGADGSVFEFWILEVIEDPGLRLAAEQKWLDIHHAAGTCYNSAITAGPAGPMAEETKRKIGNANRGNQYALGCKRTEEEKQAISRSLMGNKHTEEQNQAQSERMMGNQHALGSTHTDEFKRAMSERMMGKQYALGSKRTAEERREMSERATGELNPNWGKKHTPAAIQKMIDARRLWWAKKKEEDGCA